MGRQKSKMYEITELERRRILEILDNVEAEIDDDSCVADASVLDDIEEARAMLGGQ